MEVELCFQKSLYHQEKKKNPQHKRKVKRRNFPILRNQKYQKIVQMYRLSLTHRERQKSIRLSNKSD